jgi:hypothetical protein
MKRTWMRRAAAAGALVATLALAAPARASEWTSWVPGPDLMQTAWQWIAGLWPAPEGVEQPARDLWKEGSGVDPEGSPTNSSTTCQTDCDRGSGSDPEG